MRNVSNFERVEWKLRTDICSHLVGRQKGLLDYKEELRMQCSLLDNICGVLHFGFISESEYEKLKNLIYEAFPVECFIDI